MPEQTPRTLSHFALFRFKDAHADLNPSERKGIHEGWLAQLRQASSAVSIYQVFPAQASADILVWSALPAAQPQETAIFMERYACASNPYRRYLQPVDALWGYTQPSQYTKSRSTQEIDPFDEQRAPYLVMYPFVKTPDWYLMSREARQGIMNEHIRIGKQYPAITQMLLYSFGLQDQEFIVVYETGDLAQFSDLVYQLRDSEARRYTERDTPLWTGIYHPAETTLGLWE